MGAVRRLTAVTTAKVAGGEETCIRSAVPGGIAPEIQGGISDGGVNGGILTSVAGGITLGNGPTDVQFFASLTRKIQQPLVPNTLGPGWTATVAFLVGPATTNTQGILLTKIHDGATLTAVNVSFSVTGPHALAPGTLPNLQLLRILVGPSAVGGAISQADLAATAVQSATNPGGTGASWDSSSHVQRMTYACTQNNVIDVANYIYVLIITDEHGSNAVGGNLYMSAELVFGLIEDLRFQ